MSLKINFLLKDFDYNIRKFFDILIKHNIYEKLSFKNLSDNIFMKEKYTDILVIGNNDDIELLKSKGYEEIEYSKYSNSLVNGILSCNETIDYKIKEYNNYFYIDKTKISFSFKDNILNFNIYEPYSLLANIEYDFKIKDFIIDENGFVYIVTDNKIIKSHIAMNFYKDLETHKCITRLSDIEKIYCIDITNCKKILYADDYFIYYISNDNKKYKVELCRKYYFIKDNKIFYNCLEQTDKVTIQVEHIHFYDWISLLGLNEFYIKDDKKISTNYIDKIKNLMYFPFDSTLNGMLNYSDFLTESKDYKINLDLSFIKIIGNFNYNFEKGKYQIILKINKSSKNEEGKFQIDLIKDNKSIKRIKGNTVDNIMYFCNLKFIFYKESYDNIIVNFYINITDDYTLKLVHSNTFLNNNNVDIKDLSDFFSQDITFRRDSIKHQLIEVDYENGYLIIKDFIKNSKERNFGKDFKIRLIEPDGSISILWNQIKDKNYFLKLNTYSVVKKIKPKRTEKQLFTITRNKFKINYAKIKQGIY